MPKYIVHFEKTSNQELNDGQKMMYREVVSEEIEAAAYIPLPQKVVNFYKNRNGRVNDDIIATFYEVVSVREKQV